MQPKEVWAGARRGVHDRVGAREAPLAVAAGPASGHLKQSCKLTREHGVETQCGRALVRDWTTATSTSASNRRAFVGWFLAIRSRSSDAGNWKPWQTRKSGWLEKDLARNVELRDAIENVAWGTEEVDGVLYRKFQYVQKSEEPMPTVSEIVANLDVNSGRPAIRIVSSASGGHQFETTASFFWDQQGVLPTP